MGWDLDLHRAALFVQILRTSVHSLSGRAAASFNWAETSGGRIVF